MTIAKQLTQHYTYCNFVFVQIQIEEVLVFCSFPFASVFMILTLKENAHANAVKG